MSAAPKSSSAKAPEFLGGVMPYLQVDGAFKAGDFYTRAFGARERYRHPADDQGRTMHLHLEINGNSVILSDAYPDFGHPLQGISGIHLLLQVDDIDTWFKRAVDAGCEVVMPVEKMFWGDRYGQVRDPFGVLWAMNQGD